MTDKETMQGLRAENAELKARMEQSEAKDLERQTLVVKVELDVQFDGDVGSKKQTAEKIYKAVVSEIRKSTEESDSELIDHMIRKAYGAESEKQNRRSEK